MAILSPISPGTAGQALQWVQHGDQRLMRRLHQWRAPRWLRLWMVAATRGGDGGLWVAMGVAILVFGGEERYRAVGAAAVAVGAGVGLFLLLKRAFGRKRPCALAAAGQLPQHCWATVLPPDQFSFPSGHTITAFAIAVALGMYYPGMRSGLVFCALSVGASRVLLGMHFLSDVVAGAAIGGALGAVCAAMAG